MKPSHTQLLAFSLIVFASAMIIVGERYGWHDLVLFQLSVGGGGLGLLTGEKMASVKNEDGGQITVNAPKD